MSDGLALIEERGRREVIYYRPSNLTENYADPEERVRAEIWAELIYKYGYDSTRVGVEVTVPDRNPRDAADLVVFHDVSKKRPFAVIECKRDDISDTEFDQAVEQAVGNGAWSKLRAEYVGVVAGPTRRWLDMSDRYGALEREQNIVADLPQQYGKPSDFKFYKGTASDIRPVSRHTLISVIRKCHQTLWGGGRLSPPTAFGELCKLIFVKVADEQMPRRHGEPYSVQIKTHESSRSLAARIREVYEIQQRREPDIFTDTIRVPDSAILAIVSHLESVNLSATDLDTKGIAFEQFMDGFFKGDFGQYFTPRPIINFAVSMLNVSHDDLVVDPACGSGGFLLHALDAVRKEASIYYEENSKDHYKHWHDFASKRLHGVEINDEIARVSKMNMVLHDDGHTNVVSADALEPFSYLERQNKQLQEGNFDVVLTNPPFGANISANEKNYLESYELACKGSIVRATQKTEILFLERIWHLLKPSTGRGAVVVPDGVLTNSSLQYVRDWLLDHFQLLAVVSLPASAFTHYGAGVKASVLFVRRRGDRERIAEDEPVFMAAPDLIGYDSTGRDTESQLEQVRADYDRFNRRPKDFLR